MPNLSDIVDVAESIEGAQIRPIEKRCVAVRNRHSTCRKCVEACIADAITVESNSISINAGACVACGACAVACPTEALFPLAPTDAELAAAAASAAGEAGGSTCVIACARMASRNEADPDKYVAVPCLARVEESLIVQLVAHGVSRIALVDGVCKTCKYGGTDAGTDAIVKSANDLLAAQGSPVRAIRVSEFPDEVREETGRKSRMAARRGFFTQAGTMAKDAVKAATERALDEKLGASKPQLALRDLLKLDDEGNLPQSELPRHGALLDAMDAIGPSVADELDTRLFGNVSIDASSCRACGMCTVFCPTGALKKSAEKPADGVGSYLEFQMLDCVQCNLCADACLQSCISVSSIVSTSELFDFEPRLIHLPDPPARESLLSRLKARSV